MKTEFIFFGLAVSLLNLSCVSSPKPTPPPEQTEPAVKERSLLPLEPQTENPSTESPDTKSRDGDDTPPAPHTSDAEKFPAYE